MDPPTGPVVASVVVTPAVVSLDALGAGRQLTAVAQTASGAEVSGASFVWTSSDEARVTVDATGLVTATGNGAATITATTGGVQGMAEVTVDQIVVEVDVTPPVLTLRETDAQALSAEPQDFLGNVVADAAVAWESSDPLVVSVSPDGTATAQASGSVTITATSEGVQGAAGIAVGPDVWEPTAEQDASVAALAIAPNGDLLAASRNEGVLRSTDGGFTWAGVGTATVGTEVFSVSVTSAGDVFASSVEEVFRSTDGGDTWGALTLPVDASIRQVVVGAGDVVYLASSFGLFRSTDNGDTWPLTAFLDDVDRVAVNAAGDIFVGTELDGLFRSTDDGVTWADVTPIDIGQASIFSVAVDPDNGDLFTCCPGGLFRSTDNGDSWTDVTRDLVHVPFTIAFHAGIVYLGTCGGGVYRSTDRGAAWDPLNAGLADVDAVGLVVNPNGRIFAGTLDAGIMRSVVPLPPTVGPRSPLGCPLG